MHSESERVVLEDHVAMLGHLMRLTNPLVADMTSKLRDGVPYRSELGVLSVSLNPDGSLNIEGDLEEYDRQLAETAKKGKTRQ